MHWFTPVLGEFDARYFFLIDRSPRAMNAVLDRVNKYVSVRSDYEDIRMIAFALPTGHLRVTADPCLRKMFDAVADDIITLPQGVEVDRLTELNPRLGGATLHVKHQPGEVNPRVAYMCWLRVDGRSERCTTIPLSLTLIEQAAAGIMSVDG